MSPTIIILNLSLIVLKMCYSLIYYLKFRVNGWFYHWGDIHCVKDHLYHTLNLSHAETKPDFIHLRIYNWVQFLMYLIPESVVIYYAAWTFTRVDFWWSRSTKLSTVDNAWDNFLFISEISERVFLVRESMQDCCYYIQSIIIFCNYLKLAVDSRG